MVIKDKNIDVGKNYWLKKCDIKCTIESLLFRECEKPKKEITLSL